MYADVSFFVSQVLLTPPTASGESLQAAVTLARADGVVADNTRARVWVHVRGPHSGSLSSRYLDQLLDGSAWEDLYELSYASGAFTGSIVGDLTCGHFTPGEVQLALLVVAIGTDGSIITFSAHVYHGS